MIILKKYVEIVEHIGKALFWTALSVVVILSCFYSRPVLDRATQTIRLVDLAINESRRTLKVANTTLSENAASTKQTFSNVDAATAQLSQTISSANSMVKDVHVELTAILQTTHSEIEDARLLTQSLTRDVDTLTVSADSSLKPLGDVLTSTSRLLLTLDSQVSAASPKVQQTIDALTKNLKDMDTILANPAINETVNHVNETATTIDLSTRGLREKAGLVKTIILQVLNVIKVTIPFF